MSDSTLTVIEQAVQVLETTTGTLLTNTPVVHTLAVGIPGPQGATGAVGPAGAGAYAPQHGIASAASVAPGASTALDSAQVTVTKTGQLLHALVGSMCAWKADLYIVTNGVVSALFATWYAGQWDGKIVDPKVFTVLGSVAAGFDGFRVVVTNLDPSGMDATDVSVSYVWDEV